MARERSALISIRVDAARLTGSLSDGCIGLGSGGFGEVEGQQVGDVVVCDALRQFVEDVALKDRPLPLMNDGCDKAWFIKTHVRTPSFAFAFAN